ncbi:MAG: DUF2752 domain-containing protein [Acidobacteria bacterium]|nr:DUF2752 domain-containing protein [Acidobacteriota bacterium]
MKTGLSGAALLAALASARGLASASPSAVSVAGRELPVLCPSRLLFGVNCPGCGMTRSVLLTLGGDLRGALSVNPAGPFLVAALILLALQLLFAARSDEEGASVKRRLLPWATAYGAVVVSVMLIQWAGGLGHA